MRLSRALLPALSFASIAISGSLIAQSPDRRFSIDDVLRMQQIGTVARSPDGELVAIVVKRPAAAGEMYVRPGGNDRSDLWILSTRDGKVRKITDGVKDQSGFWSPSWSPDGKRLAFLTVTGTSPVRLGTWDRTTGVGTIRRVTDRALDPYVQVNDAGVTSPTLWLSDRTLLATFHASDAEAGFEMGQLKITQSAIDGWKKAERGAQPSISVVTSGSAKQDEPRKVVKTVAVVDVITGRLTPIVEENVKQLFIAPTRANLAIAVDGGMRAPKAGRAFGFTDSRLWKLGVTTLGTAARTRWVAGVATTAQPAPSWSPDGTRFALVGSARDGDAASVFVVRHDGDSARAALPAGWTGSGVAWSAGGQLLAMATPPPVAGAPVPAPGDTTKAKGPRPDWYAIADGGAPKNLTATLKSAPGMLVRGPGGAALGIAGDTLWSIDVAGGGTSALSTGIMKVRSIVWPRGNSAARGQVILQTGETTAPTLHRVDIAGGSPGVSTFAAPHMLAALREYDPASGSTLFTGDLPDGTFLWLGGAGAEFQRPIALNEFIAGVSAGRRMLVDYKGVEGDTLKALVVLPVGYEQGKRYPAVAWVYAGSVRKDTIYSLVDKQMVHGLNLQVLPANGYVLVVPSMPLAADGVASDPYIDLPKGVLGAMDKLVEMGIADPNKLGLMGQSYGGYSTMSLITYTNRFKAAVELAGPPDLISFYTVFEPTQRYSPDANESMFAPRWSETGQGRMGKPPWEDLWRYLRNSPLYYVERVQTPLLLLQGDLDFVSLVGGEQFFTALHRLGKPARFVRFWGEGHVLDSPANIRHQWKEIIDWFDAYLKGKAGDRTAGG